MKRFDMAVEAGIGVDEVDLKDDVCTNYADEQEDGVGGKTSTDSPMRNTVIY